MLDEKTKQTVKETIPFLEAKGTEITSLFYKNMLAAHPELLNIFNENNQKKDYSKKHSLILF
ncbi:Soluble cytochrome O [Listeria fleischmannii subsp. fleischmannii]|uniref:Soluble cytochrome O n=1 Tax=Listeria fleischmannii subsp. fleischmannii TaxID=1671902 RepID=A0A2X3HIF2_9LIST|nr:Soluble cytochrome O [Listeria fleischmannii subsp. fleischmannii]